MSAEQKKKKAEVKKEENKQKMLSEMSLEEIESELKTIQGLYKNFFDLIEELTKHRDYLLEKGKQYLYFGSYETNRILDAYETVYSAYQEYYEKLIKEFSVYYVRKQFNIKI